MLMGSICGGGAVVTSSSASETIFAWAAFAGFSSEMIVRRPALVLLKVIVLCCDFVCPIGPETLRRLAAGMFAMASNMFKSTGRKTRGNASNTRELMLLSWNLDLCLNA